MRYPIFAALLLCACGGDRAEPAAAAKDSTAASATPAESAQAPVAAPRLAVSTPEKGSFTLNKNGRVLVREQFTRTADRLETVMTAQSGGRATQTATLNPDGTVAKLHVRIFAAGTAEGGAPADQAVVRVRGDSAYSSGADTTRAEGIATQRGAIPVPLDESMAMLEQVIRRARALGGQSVEVPVLVAMGNVERVTVRFAGADSATVRVRGRELRIRTDAEGRVLSGEEPSQKLIFQRIAR